MDHKLKFRVLPGLLAICRLPAGAPVPKWLPANAFVSVTRTADELSIVCDESRVLEGTQAERNWVALKLEGPFPFTVTGVLASFVNPLAEAKVPVFVISTSDTDYVLIKQQNLQRATLALQNAGHQDIGNIEVE